MELCLYSVHMSSWGTQGQLYFFYYGSFTNGTKSNNINLKPHLLFIGIHIQYTCCSTLMSDLICRFFRSCSSYLLICHMPEVWPVCVLRPSQCSTWGLLWSSGICHGITGWVVPKILSAFIRKSRVDRGELVHLVVENEGNVFLPNARHCWPNDAA